MFKGCNTFFSFTKGSGPRMIHIYFSIGANNRRGDMSEASRITLLHALILNSKGMIIQCVNHFTK